MGALSLAAIVEKHDIRPQLPVGHVSGCEVEVQVTVSVHITKVGPHRLSGIIEILL